MKYNSSYKIYFVVASGLFVGKICFLLWAYVKLSINMEWFNLWFWLMYFLAINFTVGFLYLWDKVISRNDKITRVPELVLHILALLGGSPVALLSQKLFRHKISKKSFLIVYWLIVLLQVGVVGYFFREYLFDME